MPERGLPAPSLALGLYLLFVVYGSLVPLDFRPMPLDAAWRAFQQIPFLKLGVASRADWVANGVLYLPLGLLAALSFGAGRSRLGRMGGRVAALLLGLAVAVAVEFTQTFFPPRTVSLNDLMAESIGTALGVIVAIPGRRWGQALRAELRHGGQLLGRFALQIYLLAVLLVAFFPFDLLLSADELQAKLDSHLWGWWLAGTESRPLLTLVRLGIEVVASMPLGILLAWRAPPGRPLRWVSALLAGAALGLLVEGGQWLVASGVSQGLSVVARALGAVAGLWWWRHRKALHPARLRELLRQWTALLLPAYALLVVGLNGGFAGRWQGGGHALAVWQQIRWQPFYYHYYTSEAQAVVSLLSVLLMYLPAAALMWAWRRSAAAAAAVGFALAAVVEAGKLFIDGLRPDPTNLLIAAAVGWAALRLADRAAAGWRSPPAGVLVGTTMAADAARSPPPGPVGLALLAVVAALVSAALAPAFGGASAALVVLCAAIAWWRPLAPLWLLPALLPMLALAPWTGRRLWDEFDAVMLACLAIGYLRMPRRPDAAPAAHGLRELALGLVALSFALATLHTLTGLIDGGPLRFDDAWSPFEALWIAKGVVWALLFTGLLRRALAARPEAAAQLAWGLSLALAAVVAWVLWERLAFVGLADFVDAYRVTGPFSAMRRGGAYVECFIAACLPFALGRALAAGRWPLRLLAAALVMAAGYAMAVTYSRNGYAAFAVALLLSLVPAMAGAMRRQPGSLRAWGLAALALLLALPVLLGPVAQQRLARSADDLAVRQAHWADALAMRDDTALATVFGMGLGRFPELHFFRSREAVRAGTFRVVAAPGSSFLRLGAGAPGYLDQIVSVPAQGTLSVSARLRSDGPAAALTVSLCEKWMLTSLRCTQTELRSAGKAGEWAAAQATLPLGPLAAAQGWSVLRMVKFSLHTPTSGATVDVADVRLTPPGGRDLLGNGDFGRGLARWLYTTDVDPPWHLHSLPLALLFDQGLFGLLAMGTLVALALLRGARSAWRGDRLAGAAWAGLAAFAVSGSLNTLIDEPRFVFLLLLLAWLAAGRPAARRTAAAQA